MIKNCHNKWNFDFPDCMCLDGWFLSKNVEYSIRELHIVDSRIEQ